MNTLPDDGMPEDQAVLYDGALSDLNTPSDNGILNCTPDIASVCNHRILHNSALEIMNRAGIGRLRVNRPV